MTCFYPIPGYRSRERNPETGRYGITFKSSEALVEGQFLTFPCGKCVGCRLDRSLDWAVRCSHERQLYQDNCFITLTYNDEHLPSDFSVHVRPLQLFMKRLRESVPNKIRFFACGEYGEDDPNPLEGNRPHFHLLIFNYRPTDLVVHSRKKLGTKTLTLYISEKIQKLWIDTSSGKSLGFSTVGELTYESAAYTARYTMKKIGGSMADEHYTRIHPLSGNLVRVKPEFMVSSRRPGIGDAWYETFKSDIYPSDFCVVDGRKRPVPKFYIKKYEEEERQKIKRRRKAASNKKRADNTPARLRVREEVQLARVSTLKRSLK